MKHIPKVGRSNKMIFDLEMGDRFMTNVYQADGKRIGSAEVEVVSPYEYAGLPYRFGRILMEEFYDNVVYAVRTDDRSMIIPFIKNRKVFAY